MKNYHQIKDKIILLVFDYMDTGKKSHKIEALECLDQLRKCFNIKKKKIAKMELKQAFRQFVLNGRGYIETINKLYSSL